MFLIIVFIIITSTEELLIYEYLMAISTKHKCAFSLISEVFILVCALSPDAAPLKRDQCSFACVHVCVCLGLFFVVVQCWVFGGFVLGGFL